MTGIPHGVKGEDKGTKINLQPYYSPEEIHNKAANYPMTGIPQGGRERESKKERERESESDRGIEKKKKKRRTKLIIG